MRKDYERPKEITVNEQDSQTSEDKNEVEIVER